MRRTFLLALALAGCGVPEDRLSDKQAAAEQNAVSEAPVAIDQPPAPGRATPAAANTYKAVGTEPGWALAITGATMIYQGDYGSVTISEPTAVGFRPAPGRYTGKRLKLAIAPGPCSDGMSDLVYRHTVRLTADGKTVTGCGGGTVPPAGLAGTNWKVTAINGRSTPGGQDFFINFRATNLSAKFGCNGVSGAYQVNGDHLATEGVVQTLMGCPEPAATFERLASAILASNVRVERSSNEAARLVSEAGSIDLKRTH